MKWRLEGQYYQACSCDYGCPCEFEAPPTRGFCEDVSAWHVESGRYGDVFLDGISFGVAARWPGALHEGNGVDVPYFDDRANDGQRDALMKIITGEAKGVGPFEIVITTLSKVLEPQYVPIEINHAGKNSSAKMGTTASVAFEPIKNPVTGEPEGIRILLFANVNRKHREQQGPFVPTRVFLLGYVVAWAAFAALATVANWGLHSGGLLSSMMGENTSSYLGGGLLLAAGAFQWSRLKSVCLTHCRTPMGFLMTGCRDGVGGARSILSGMLLGPDDPIVCPGGDEPRLDSRAVRLRPFREDRPGWPSAKPRYRPCADRLGRVGCSPE